MQDKRKDKTVAYQTYDYAGWQERLQLTSTQAAEALDVSVSFYLTLRRKSTGRKLYAWAAYGIEAAAGKQV